MSKKRFFIITVILIATVCVATAVGSSNIELSTVMSILGYKIFGIPLAKGITTNQVSIIWLLRFPRALLALVIGASLAVSGSCIQSVLRNPLASPYTLGVSAGSTFGVALVIVSGFQISFLGEFTLMIAGLISSLLTITLIIYFSTKIDKYLSNQTIILAGMVFSLFINALLTVIIALSGEDMKKIIMWQMGSLAFRSWSYLSALLPFFIAGTLGIIYYSKELDALSFGEENAISLGVDVKLVKRKLIFLSAVLAGSAVAVCGTIGFIGLVAPHIVRRVFGSRHSTVLPVSIMFGGVFLILMDLIARTVMSPAELPVGAITALIGAPFFGFIYFSKRKG